MSQVHRFLFLVLLLGLMPLAGCITRPAKTTGHILKTENAMLIYMGPYAGIDKFEFSRPDGTGTFYFVQPDTNEVLVAMYVKAGETLEFSGIKINGPSIAVYFVPEH